MSACFHFLSLFIRSRWMLLAFGIVLLSLISVVSLLPAWVAGQVASPARRELMDYHREILSRPGFHGIHVERFRASDGTPALVVTPSGHPGKRGRILRKQLTEGRCMLPEFGEVRGTLVLLHGRVGRKEDLLPVAERFCACGFRCILPDLPAHGEHPEPFATYGLREQTIPERVLRDAAELFSFPAEPAGLFGISMGGSVAIHAAARSGAPWKSLIVVASFPALADTVEREVANRLGKPVAARWFPIINEEFHNITSCSLDQIEPRKLAPSIRIPVLLVHGSADELIPVEESRDLSRAFPENPGNRWIEVPDGDHDQVLITPYPVYAEAVSWMIPFME